MKISEHLSLAEVVRSESAKRFGINNNPTEEHLANLKELAINIFEPLRKHFDTPIYVSSGYRSQGLNAKIKGSKTSQHCLGQALDLDMDFSSSGITNSMIFHYIKANLDFDQLIWEFGNTSEPDWVHVSYDKNKTKQRNQVLIAYKENGRTKYRNYA